MAYELDEKVTRPASPTPGEVQNFGSGNKATHWSQYSLSQRVASHSHDEQKAILFINLIVHE